MPLPLLILPALLSSAYIFSSSSFSWFDKLYLLSTFLCCRCLAIHVYELRFALDRSAVVGLVSFGVLEHYSVGRPISLLGVMRPTTYCMSAAKLQSQ